MRAAGIDIATGVLAGEAAALNQGYLGRAGGGRPMLTLKAATTLDGRIATAAGESKWITGGAARRWAHAMRARHDAVMVGIGTVLADDPELTCRLPGLPARPTVRVVMDSKLRLPLDGRLVRGAGTAPVWAVTSEGAQGARRSALTKRGVEVIEVTPGGDGRPDPAAALTALGARGLTRILVEGGGVLAASLLAAGLVDRLAWFRAARLIGGDGAPMPAAFGVGKLADAPSFVREACFRAGDDMLETYRRAP